jgi:hypothetical protein
MTQAQLTITVVLANGVDQPLRTDKESEVITAAHTINHNLLVEWHLHWNTVLLARFNEWPRKSQAIISCGERQVTTSSDRADLEALLGEEIEFCRLINISIVTQTQLSFLVTAPGNQLLSVRNQDQIPVFNSQQLLRLHRPLLVLRILWQSELHLSHFTRVFNDNLIALLIILGALAIIVPSPRESLSFARACQGMTRAHTQCHDGSIVVHLLSIQLHPLTRPGGPVHFL